MSRPYTLTLIIFNILLLNYFNIHAQQTVIPTKGKEFWFSFLSNYQPQTLSSDRLYVYVSSNKNTTGTITLPQSTYSQNFSVTANVTTELVLPKNIAEALLSERIENKGFLLQTEDTVSVFIVNFEEHTADGTKVFPVQSLGYDYRVMAYNGDSEFLIVATQDNTEIEIIPSAVTALGKPANVPFYVILNQGDVYQVRSSTDLTGSTIKSTAASGSCRPFAVFAGVECASIPIGCSFCDHIVDQQTAINSWSQKYHVAPLLNSTSYSYRVLANRDNTQISIDGAAPVTLNAGEFTEGSGNNAIVITGTKEINVVQYLQGSTCSGGLGDPAMVTLNGSKQQLSDITFATMESDQITEHKLNIICPTQNISELFLDNLPIPPSNFNIFPADPDFSYARIPLIEGSHRLLTQSYFTGAYIYGTGFDESYAYSAGSFLPPLFIDTIYCSTDSITLINVLNFTDPYWTSQSNPNDTLAVGDTFTILPIGGEIYIVNGYEEPSKCFNQYFYLVESADPPNITLTKSMDSLCPFQAVRLTAEVTPPSNSYKYQWTPSTLVSNPNSAETIARPGQSTWFYCRVYTSTGCVDVVDSIFIHVQPNNLSFINPLPSDSLICLGDTILLQANSQTAVFYDNFDTGIHVDWLTVSGGEASTVCGFTTGNGLWFNRAGSREAITKNLDVSTGGTIQFDLKIASGSFPCDNADFGEDVVLEYSIDNGTTWNDLAIYYESSYPTFQRIKLFIPAPAQTTTTRFRWRQLSNSGVNEDNWIIDEVLIAAIDSADFTYSWSPADSVFTSNTFSTHTSPKRDITYYVRAESTEGCIYNDSIKVGVGEPFELLTTNDTLMCYIDGIQLQALPTAGEGHTIVWTPDSSLTFPESFTPIAKPDVTTQYFVEVTSKHGCSAKDSITISYVRKSDLIIIPPGDTICIGDTTSLTGTIINASGCSITDTALLATTVDTTTVIETSLVTDSGTTDFFNGLISNTRRLQYELNDYSFNPFAGGLYASGYLIDNGLISEELLLGVALYIDSIGINSTFENFTIKLACDEASLFTDYGFAQNLVTVFTPKTITLDTGWNYFTFDAAYYLQGEVREVHIDFCYENSDSNSFASMKVESVFNKAGYSTATTACDTSIGLNYDYVPSTRIIHSKVHDRRLIYNWSPGTEVDDSTAMTISTSPENTVIYSLNVTDTASGCVFKESARIQVDDTIIDVSVMPLDTFICDGALLQLNANGGNFYSWSPITGLNDPLIPNPVANPSDSTVYTVTISNACWSVERSLVVDVQQSPSIEPLDDISLCYGDSVQLNLISDEGIINWSPAYGLSNPNIKNPILFTNQSLTYNVTLTDFISRCFNSVSFTADVYERENGELLSSDTTICLGDTIQLRATGAEKYFWSPDDFLSFDTSAITEAFPNQPTTFTVVLSYENCQPDTQSITINVDSFLFEGFEDTIICHGEEVLLYATGNTTLSYIWSPLTNLTEISDDSVLVAPGQSITYYVTAQNTRGCESTDSVNVEVINILGNLLDDTSIVLGESIHITGLEPGYTYDWSPKQHLNCNNCPEPIATPAENITYIVLVQDSSGKCSYIDSITITVVDPFLEIPSAFSPNGDGNNDIFIPVQAGVKEVIRFDIYNRWGQLVFSTEQTNSGWDGSFNGKMQPIGIYNYVFKARMFAEADTEVERSGTVLLAR